jgi:hypothetical protein
VQRTFDFVLPEFDELKEDREVWRKVKFVPDELIENRPVVRHTVKQSGYGVSISMETKFHFGTDTRLMGVLNWL